MATKINYSDLASSNYETTIRIGTTEKRIMFGDYGSCYGEYDKPIAINNSMNPVSTVDSTKLISNYFSTHKPITNGLILAGKNFTSDTPAGYIKFTSHGKTMIINVTVIGEAIEKNIEFNDSLNNYKIYVEDSSNCSLKLYYIYYEGKDSEGNWKKIKPSSKVLTKITLKFADSNVLYTEDNYSNQYVYWDKIPQEHINNLPVTATATISLIDDTGATITDTQTIQFINEYIINLKERTYTTCPNSKISISFEIKDNSGNYLDVNNISSFSATLNNTNFTKSDCKFNSNENTIEVTTSGTNGDTAQLTLKIGDIINEIITINNKTTYSCGGIEVV